MNHCKTCQWRGITVLRELRQDRDLFTFKEWSVLQQRLRPDYCDLFERGINGNIPPRSGKYRTFCLRIIRAREREEALLKETRQMILDLIDVRLQPERRIGFWNYETESARAREQRFSNYNYMRRHRAWSGPVKYRSAEAS